MTPAAAGEADPWRGATLPPPSWDDDERGPSALGPDAVPMTPALRAWKRRMLAQGTVLTLGAAVLFLWAVFIIRERPMTGYFLGAGAVLAVSFGVLFVKFCLWGPYPDHVLEAKR